MSKVSDLTILGILIVIFLLNHSFHLAGAVTFLPAVQAQGNTSQEALEAAAGSRGRLASGGFR